MIELSAGKIDLFKDVLTGACHSESAWVPLATRGWSVEPKSIFRRRAEQWLHCWLDRKGWVLVKRAPFDDDKRRLGQDWPWVGYTMVGRTRLDHLQSCVESVLDEGIEGDFIETGVWRGGACLLMKAMLQWAGDQKRQIWLADSFAGLPAPNDKFDGWDLSGNPSLMVTADTVRNNFRRFGLWDERVRLLEGWFEDTLPTAPIDRLSILRLDGDLYESTRVSLEALYHRVSPGGFVIIDDYHPWPGCRRAVDEFRLANGECGEMQEIDGTAVAWRKSRVGD
jgi:O-methyltransferase